jgi:hypothetical protein
VYVVTYSIDAVTDTAFTKIQAKIILFVEQKLTDLFTLRLLFSIILFEYTSVESILKLNLNLKELSTLSII